MKTLTVGMLKDLLKNFPDEAEVEISPTYKEEYGGEEWLCIETEEEICEGVFVIKDNFIWENEW